MEALAIPLLLAVGGLLAVQAAANLQLAAGVGGPFPGATVQLGIGAAVLLALAVATGDAGALQQLGDAPAWHLIGGLGSAVYVLAGIVLFPRLGAVVTVGLLIAGQMAASFVLDATGALGVPRETLGPVTAVGAVAVAAGVAVVVRAQGGRARGVGSGWLALAVAAGAVLPLQGTVNAQLRADLDAPVAAGAWSFVVAAAAMALVLALRRERPALPPATALPWWGWLGGLCGAAYVTSVFVLIPEIGVAPTVTLTVAGQQLASVLVDRHGLLRLPRRPVGAARLGGVALLLVGVAALQAA